MSNPERRAPTIRRIVTTHDARGKAVVWMDKPAGNHKFANEFVTSTLLWSTDTSPADFSRNEDYGERQLGLQPPPNGSRFVHLEIKPGMTVPASGPTPGLHRTETLDYGIVVAGEISLYLDDGKKLVMRPGDVCVQRGTNHSWVNEGTETVRLINVLLDGGPKRTA